MKYITTRKQCQETINKYKNVCRGCGGKLSPLKTVDNSGDPTYWVGCKICMCFDNGTKPRIHEIAKKMVDERNYRAYSHDEKPDKEQQPERYEYWRTSQIRGTVSVVHDVIKYLIT